MSSTSTWRLVFLPAVVVTWAVLLIRLGGELVGGPSWLFGRDGGGGGAIVGITWLVMIFGFYFGWRLTKEGRGPDKPVLTLILSVLAIAAGVGGMMGANKLGFIDFEKPGRDIAYTFLVVLGASSLLLLWSWRELFLANLVYGLLARVGVIVVTVPAVLNSWDTHFNKGQQGMVEPTWQGIIDLSHAQICFWTPFTVLMGGLFGSIAGLIAGGRKLSAVQPGQAGAAGMVGSGDV